MQPERYRKLREITREAAELETVLLIAPGKPTDGLIETKDGMPALCCARCSRMLAKRLDTVLYAGLVLHCEGCDTFNIIE